jgi:hypothetical protein
LGVSVGPDGDLTLMDVVGVRSAALRVRAYHVATRDARWQWCWCSRTRSHNCRTLSPVIPVTALRLLASSIVCCNCCVNKRRRIGTKNRHQCHYCFPMASGPRPRPRYHPQRQFPDIDTYICSCPTLSSGTWQNSDRLWTPMSFPSQSINIV